MNKSAAFLSSNWAPGVCHFCGITDAEVDGDRVRWFDASRSVCSGPGCISQFRVAVERWERRRRPARKLNSAEVHELILAEERAKRRRYRQAAKARRKGRAA